MNKKEFKKLVVNILQNKKTMKKSPMIFIVFLLIFLLFVVTFEKRYTGEGQTLVESKVANPENILFPSNALKVKNISDGDTLTVFYKGQEKNLGFMVLMPRN